MSRSASPGADFCEAQKLEVAGVDGRTFQRSEILRLIMDVENMDMPDVRDFIEIGVRASCWRPSLRWFEKNIIDGNWPQVMGLLVDLIPEESMYKEAKVRVIRQQYLEMLAKQQHTEAMEFLKQQTLKNDIPHTKGPKADVAHHVQRHSELAVRAQWCAHDIGRSRQLLLANLRILASLKPMSSPAEACHFAFPRSLCAGAGMHGKKHRIRSLWRFFSSTIASWTKIPAGTNLPRAGNHEPFPWEQRS